MAEMQQFVHELFTTWDASAFLMRLLVVDQEMT
jgi:hypothetical protein